MPITVDSGEGMCNYCSLDVAIMCIAHLSHVVIHLEGTTPTKYGLLLNNDDRYKDVKRELSKYCGLSCSQLLLVEIFGASVKVLCRCETVVTSVSAMLETVCGKYLSVSNLKSGFFFFRESFLYKNKKYTEVMSLGLCLQCNGRI